MRKLVKFFSFSWSDKIALFQGLASALRVKSYIWMLKKTPKSNGYLDRHLKRALKTKAEEDISLTSISTEIRTFVRIRQNFPLSCLEECLLMQSLARKRQVALQIQLGARKGEKPQPEIHAWIEVNGCILAGQHPQLPEFQVFKMPNN